MKRYPRRLMSSLSVKLIAAFVAAAVALTGLLWWALDITFERQFSDTIQPYFSKHLISLQQEVGFPPDINIAKAITLRAPVHIVIEAPSYRWSSNGDFIDKPYLDVKLQRLGEQGVISEAGFYKGDFILRTFHQGYITSFIITEKLDKLPRLNDIGIILLVTLFIIALLFWVIHRLFAPVAVIEHGVKRIGAGDITHRLTINRLDELGELATTINKMAANIEQMLEAKRQLLLAISHELRTPMTRAKLALSMLEDSQDKSSIGEDLNEMETLIHELLESERLRENHAPLEYHQVDINEMIYQVQGRFFAEAKLDLDLYSPLPLLNLDAGRISLAIKNIIKNALTASQADASVKITTQLRKNHVAITVADKGIGIDKALIPQLTEPFYRTDCSRQRDTGGVGIGLYLIKAIIDAHHGELLIDSDINQGTTVSIWLPINALSSENCTP